MRTLSLAKLEEARRRPASFRERLRRNATGGGPSYGPSNALRSAIMLYHARFGDTQAAHAYLEDKYLQHWGDDGHLGEWQQRLDAYLESFGDLGATVGVLNGAVRMVFPELDVRVTGRIPRLDITSDGYAAWLFSLRPIEWRAELRSPLLQGYWADQMGCPVDEVRVGLCVLETGEHESAQFTQEQVSAARQEQEELLRFLVEPA